MLQYNNPLSSVDITDAKKKKLWLFIIIVISLLVILIVKSRPQPRPFIKKRSSSLVEVKATREDFQHWAQAYDNDIENLKATKKNMQQTLDKTTDKVEKLGRHIAEQADLLKKIIAKFNKASPDNTAHHGFKNQSRENIRPQPLLITSKPHKYSKQYLATKMLDIPKARWLPVGSFFTATLLNGIDAGTGLHAQANPQPVLMRIDSQAFLPNHARYPVRACFVLGSAYGALPSQRALIRTVKISCVSPKGNAVIDQDLKGYVVDMDGKIGLRGTLINRQGAKLAKAMLAGFLGGLSNTFGQVKQHVIRPEKSEAHHISLSPKSSFALAGLSGINNATKELTHFYINQAKQLFPVIEVNAGRHVVINVSEGVGLMYHTGGKLK